MTSNLLALLERFPRLPVALLPTPLHPLAQLRKALGPGAPDIVVKRDDLTGLALGGNKARKLEYLFGDARAHGADTLLTCGAAQSNHALQTAAAARKFGFAVRCILDGPPAHSELSATGNLLLHAWLQTPIRWAEKLPGETRNEQARRRVQAEETEYVREEGGAPYSIPTGGSTPVGALGYVRAMAELKSQLDATDTAVSTIFFASGSGGTQAGMAVGAAAMNWNVRLIGVEVDPIPLDAHGVSPFLRAIRNLTRETGALLGQDDSSIVDRVELCPDYAGAAYGIPTKEGQEAIRLLAETEGIFCDPVYSGKALSALFGWIREGRFAPDETVLFWHTGGVAGLFAQH